VRIPPNATRLAPCCLALALTALAGGALAQSSGSERPPPESSETVLSVLRGAAEEDTPAEEEADTDFAVEEAADVLTEFPDQPVPVPGDTEDPYAPLGLRLGSFRLFPAIEGFLGYTNNVFADPNDPAGGSYYRIVPELEVISDWIRHELRAFVSVDHESFFDYSGETTTGIDSELEGRLDISERDVAGLLLSYSIIPETRGDPNVPQAVVEPPNSLVGVAEGTYAHQFGRVELSLRGAIEDFTYENALLSDGTVVDNSDRDYLDFNGTARASVTVDDGSREIFIEAGANRRNYRDQFDSNGIERGSRGYDVLVGVAYDDGGPLSGEIGVGYLQQFPDDPNLRTVDSIAFEASLIWTPSALTTFTFEGSILPEETVLDPDASGVLVYTASLGVEHAFRRNLIGSAGFIYAQSDYVGSTRVERDYLATLGLDYLVNRWLSFQLDASYHTFDSTVVGEDYDEARIEFGVRLQR
jgi:hypothetical protein